MITKDVPIAIIISSPANKTKAGIIKNPPPAPTNPVIAYFFYKYKNIIK